MKYTLSNIQKRIVETKEGELFIEIKFRVGYGRELLAVGALLNLNYELITDFIMQKESPQKATFAHINDKQNTELWEEVESQIHYYLESKKQDIIDNLFFATGIHPVVKGETFELIYISKESKHYHVGTSKNLYALQDYFLPKLFQSMTHQDIEELSVLALALKDFEQHEFLTFYKDELDVVALEKIGYTLTETLKYAHLIEVEFSREGLKPANKLLAEGLPVNPSHAVIDLANQVIESSVRHEGKARLKTQLIECYKSAEVREKKEVFTL